MTARPHCSKRSRYRRAWRQVGQTCQRASSEGSVPLACRDMRAPGRVGAHTPLLEVAWKLRYPMPVSKDDEATESTDDISLGFPCDLIAVICISVHPHLDRSGGCACVTYGSGSHILHPDSCCGLIWQPRGLVRISFEFRCRHGRVPERIVASHAELRSTGLRILLHSVNRI